MWDFIKRIFSGIFSLGKYRETWRDRSIRRQEAELELGYGEHSPNHIFVTPPEPVFLPEKAPRKKRKPKIQVSSAAASITKGNS